MDSVHLTHSIRLPSDSTRNDGWLIRMNLNESECVCITPVTDQVVISVQVAGSVQVVRSVQVAKSVKLVRSVKVGEYQLT